MTRNTPARRRSVVRSAISAALLLVAPLAVLPPATAVSTPATAAPAVVSADALPTVQVDGVVWDTLVVGQRVYVTGKFAQARPAGAAPGTNQTARANILAFDLATGNLITTWNASLDAQGLALAASADGSRIFVAGDFGTVNGTARARVAALDARTGALVTGFKANANARVRALTVRGDTLYLGGIFTTLGGQARTRLGAVSTITGAVTTWAPAADAEVMALAAPTGTGAVVAAGRFTTLNGATARGSGSLDAGTGTSRPWALNATIQNYGPDSAIYSLTTSGTQVFGSGYDFYGPSDFENTFAADATTGSLTWVAGCYGDTYDTAPVDGVLYSVGHPHNCSAIGGNPETTPRSFQRAMVTTTTAAADGATNVGGPFPGKPRPDLLAWTPDLASGKFTGQQQAAWTASATSGFLVLGGEFPTVNGTAQQGLVRFATRANSPRKQGPVGYAELTPKATATAPGTLRVSWRAAYDRDDRALTYDLLRGDKLSTATVVDRRTVLSAWWNRPTVSFSDRTAPAGTSTYRVRVSDPDGNTVVSATATATAPTGTVGSSPYADAVLGDGATSFWRLGEGSGATAFDSSGTDDLTLPASAVRGATGAVSGDTATTFSGAGALQGASSTLQAGPQTFSVEAWVQTRSTAGGKLVGFGNSRTAASGSYDRHVYMTPSGQLVFGAYPGSVRTVTSPRAYNDGAWHHVVATLGKGGMQLFVDGALVGSRADTTSAQAFSGYWRVGGDTVAGSWPTRPTSEALAGAIDEVAVYPQVLTTAQVRTHANLGGLTAPNDLPVARATTMTAGLTATLDGTSSSEPDGRVVAWDWDLGDGTTTTGATPSHAYAEPGTYTVTLTVTDDRGATASTTRTVEVTMPVVVPAPLARDTFTRSVITGLGAADAGGAWATSGSGSTSSVDGSSGVVTVNPGRASAARLPVATDDVTLTTTMRLSALPTGGGVYSAGVVRAGTDGEYRAKVRVLSDGSVTLGLTRLDGSVETTLAPAVTTDLRLDPSVGVNALVLRVEASGSSPTTLRARVWAEGSAEPTSWTRSVTDSTPTRQGPGGLGLWTYLSGSSTTPSTVLYDDLLAQRP